MTCEPWLRRVSVAPAKMRDLVVRLHVQQQRRDHADRLLAVDVALISSQPVPRIQLYQHLCDVCWHEPCWSR